MESTEPCEIDARSRSPNPYRHHIRGDLCENGVVQCTRRWQISGKEQVTRVTRGIRPPHRAEYSSFCLLHNATACVYASRQWLCVRLTPKRACLLAGAGGSTEQTRAAYRRDTTRASRTWNWSLEDEVFIFLTVPGPLNLRLLQCTRNHSPWPQEVRWRDCRWRSKFT